ncbi:hypothetical protein YDYSG_57730 [Paenibacillus tyrfis]|uniref:hypothetical protein n=1 Tax=Paenibacillus tyrfis TaxID=1501230 RepID=UPI00248F5A2E|nr:hypothetical protein [Paenibacillus tyrfis]GLI09741.1 hypothetical protein YDYSG_57730 [Paenibacillus tyrfis]
MFTLKKSIPLLSILATLTIASAAYAANDAINLAYQDAKATGSLVTDFSVFENDKANARTDWQNNQTWQYLVVGVTLKSAENISAAYEIHGSDYGNWAHVSASKGGVWAFQSDHKILDRYNTATVRTIESLTSRW